MTSADLPGNTTRRTALRGMVGAGAITAALPLLDQCLNGIGLPGLLTPAFAQGSVGVQSGQGDVVYIPQASAQTVVMSEWEGILGAAETGVVSNRVVTGKEAADKAPANASRYMATTYQFPTGALRILKFQKGTPLFHQIAFETEILVLQGSATLSPLHGIKGETIKVGAGDALYLPNGTLRNAKLSEDTVLLLAQAASTSPTAKGGVIRAKDASNESNAHWQEGGKEMAATKPEDIRKAPASAARWGLKRYAFDGNSIRIATFKKGGRTNMATNGRSDIMIYVPKGHFRRHEGSQTFDLVAGDATREKLGNPGYWEILEDSVFIAIDAPLNPAAFAPTMVAR